MALMITTLLLFIQRGLGEIVTFSTEWKCMWETYSSRTKHCYVIWVCCRFGLLLRAN